MEVGAELGSLNESPERGDPQNLQRIEPGVAHDCCHAASTTHVEDRPEGTEHGRRDNGVPSLKEVTEAKRQREHYHSHDHAAQMSFETVEQERALHLLADASGDDGNEGEGGRLQGSAASQLFERIDGSFQVALG